MERVKEPRRPVLEMFIILGISVEIHLLGEYLFVLDLHKKQHGCVSVYDDIMVVECSGLQINKLQRGDAIGI